MGGELAVGLLVVVALALIGVAARWLLGCPEGIRAALSWVAARPVVQRVRSRYPRQWRFVGRRLAPGEAAGLALTLGVVAVLALGVGFAQLLDSVLEGDGVTVADRPVLRFLAAHREPWSTTVARVITDVGSPVGVAVTGLAIGLVLARLRRSWLPLIVVALGGGGIAVIDTVVKGLVGRHRPSQVIAVLGAHGSSFPSGHTIGTTVVWLLLAWMISHGVSGRGVSGHGMVNRRAGCVTVWTGALLMIVLVGLTRVYLGVHFPTDVLAGWVLGAAWALIVALVVTVWGQSRRRIPRGGARSTSAGRS